MSRHISEQYDSELESVRMKLMTMGGLVEKQLESATRAFVTHDIPLASDVRDGDDEVNKFEVVIDDECISIIARRSPTASDLRLLVSIMKTSTDLERVGDEADRIAKVAKESGSLEIPSDSYAEIQHISSLVAKMLARALDAFARLDASNALDVINADAEVDREYDTIIRKAGSQIAEQPDLVDRWLNVIWAARALERIGDHAKNISEHVVYLVDGEDVRHSRSRSHGA